ncbi:PREDICTED: uncharacterized protein LOC105518962 [Colobus angolensis palliatus]|uniref:uncharacterized protein LOC105518962 n=1 Tax=Colobus angolensis palliatus TaxID=336983 RepID=UPI0005F455ED|nr:PREDICTED: uncharacterized protein LOC105518962 [Colobus angolensis palliatus]
MSQRPAPHAEPIGTRGGAAGSSRSALARDGDYGRPAGRSCPQASIQRPPPISYQEKLYLHLDYYTCLTSRPAGSAQQRLDATGTGAVHLPAGAWWVPAQGRPEAPQWPAQVPASTSCSPGGELASAEPGAFTISAVWRIYSHRESPTWQLDRASSLSISCREKRRVIGATARTAAVMNPCWRQDWRTTLRTPMALLLICPQVPGWQSPPAHMRMLLHHPPFTQQFSRGKLTEARGRTGHTTCRATHGIKEKHVEGP